MTTPERPSTPEKLFPWVFLVCTVAGLVPLWSLKYPPMVDLPQHAAQVFIWQHYHDPAYAFGERYVLNFVSPYLFGYTLARGFAEFLPIHAALKVVVSLVIVALPSSMLFLCLRLGVDRWGALLGFPLAYGFAFHWGFLNYLIAVPAGVVYVALGLDLARDPSRRRGAAVAVLGIFLYACHALVLGLAALAVGVHLLLAAVPWRQKLRALVPLAVPAPVIGAWMVWIRRVSPMTATETLWNQSLATRLIRLPETLLRGAQETVGPWWWLGGLVCLVLPFLAGRPAWRRLGPLLAAVAAYFLMPDRWLGTFFLYPRLAVFIPILTLAALEPASTKPKSPVARGLLAAFAVAWMAFLTARFSVLAPEGRDFDAVVRRVEPGASLLGLSFDPGYGYGTGLPVFGHFAAWVEAQKGGRAEFSFASSFPQIAHYRPGAGPWSSPDLVARPDWFVWQRDGRFDYYLVRSQSERGAYLFRQATVPIDLAAHVGKWWLYHRRGPQR